jgi:hypothetical protein
MKSVEIASAGFSQHLFWDVDKDALEWEKSAPFIIKRVLEYGLWEDWKIIHKHYGIKLIAEKSMDFRELEPKALNFISTLSNIPTKAFRCYTTIQSKNPHWNF